MKYLNMLFLIMFLLAGCEIITDSSGTSTEDNGNTDTTITSGTLVIDESTIDVSSYGTPYDVTQNSGGIDLFSANWGPFTYQPRIIPVVDSDGNLKIAWIENSGTTIHLITVEDGEVTKHS